MPPEWNACARQSRVCPCYTTWCAPIIRCRSASLAVVQPNHRLPEHSTMRRASAMLHSVRSLPPFYRHSRLTIVRRGCWICRNAEIHGEAMYTAPDCAARAVLQAVRLQWKTFLSGDQKGDTLFREREYPPLPAPPHGVGNKEQHFVLQFYSDKRILSLSSSCPAPALNRAMRSSTPIPARSLPAMSSTMCPSAIISVRLPSSSA